MVLVFMHKYISHVKQQQSQRPKGTKFLFSSIRTRTFFWLLMRAFLFRFSLWKHSCMGTRHIPSLVCVINLCLRWGLRNVAARSGAMACQGSAETVRSKAEEGRVCVCVCVCACVRACVRLWTCMPWTIASGNIRLRAGKCVWCMSRSSRRMPLPQPIEARTGAFSFGVVKISCWRCHCPVMSSTWAWEILRPPLLLTSVTRHVTSFEHSYDHVPCALFLTRAALQHTMWPRSPYLWYRGHTDVNPCVNRSEVQEFAASWNTRGFPDRTNFRGTIRLDENRRTTKLLREDSNRFQRSNDSSLNI